MSVELDRLIDARILNRRLNRDGRVTWGPQNKLARHVPSGIPVDLFATTELAWWNYLVCRTGPAELNKQIATAAQAKGWKWNPYGPGFSRDGPLAGARETVAATSEEQVFAFAGIPYLPPERRG